MDEQKNYQILKVKLSSRGWRLSNLYTIIDKNGKKIPFIPNTEQAYFLANIWYSNVILKARQLGFSTLIEMFILDECLFNSNTHAGIIDWNLPDAKKKLEKCKLAYENMSESFKATISINTDNAQELKFSNGSTITADTSFRGDTLQLLHISEHAKICKKDPIKAREIKTGAINSLSVGQKIFIESTAEDGEGDFYDICTKAEELSLEKKELSQLDFKFFFFPWWKDNGYQLEKPQNYVFSTESENYFRKIAYNNDIQLTDDQKFWYVKKKELLGEDIKKEFPSTSKEAFESTTQDKYYGEIINLIQQRNQICEFDIDPAFPIDLAFDLGRSDYTSIGFFQTIGKEVRVVDFAEFEGVHFDIIIGELKNKHYKYGKIFLPHDAKADLLSTSKNIYQQVIESNLAEFANVKIVEKLDIEIGINEVRKILPNMWFRHSKTFELVNHLKKYSKKWSEQLGIYQGPKHDEHSHASDMMRYFAIAYRPELNENIEADPYSFRRRKKVEEDNEPAFINPLAGF